MEAGLDSIGAVELRNSVSAKFGVELPATVTFDQPTIQDLAQFLAGRVAPPQGQFAVGAVTHTLQTGPDARALVHNITQVQTPDRKRIRCIHVHAIASRHCSPTELAYLCDCAAVVCYGWAALQVVFLSFLVSSFW